MVLANSLDLVNILDYIYQALKTLISFIAGIMSATLELLSVVGRSIDFTAALAAYLPPVLGSCVLLVVFIYVIKLIAGR